ncbi:MAG: SDR family oxidoreductase [Comamonadaceae bacterium]|nr:MAG: SDR family oxidoreductase [Comamonadaceae bacterium]
MRVIVTGAARGIGRAICLRLARDASASGGVRMVVSDQRLEDLQGVIGEVEALGGQAIGFAGDISDPALPARIVQATDAFGGLDALVSNAGFAIPGPLADYDIDNWDKVFAVHVRAPWLLAKAAYPALKASRGAIVVTASISGTNAQAPLGAYSASKAAALMLVRQLANEWGPDGIRVNAFSPGLTITPGTAAAYSTPDARAQRESRVPLRRMAEADDMAGVVAFLLGKDAAYVQGVDLLVDGGLSNTVMASLDMNGWKK